MSRLRTVITPAPQAIVDFRPQAVGPETTREVWITMQPLSAREIERLEPGLRTRAKYAAFTFEPLRYVVPGSNEPPEFVEFNGTRFEVHGGYDDGAFDGCPIRDAYEFILAYPTARGEERP